MIHAVALLMGPPSTAIKRPVIVQHCWSDVPARIPPIPPSSRVFMHASLYSFKRHQVRSCVAVRHEWINVSTPRMTFHSAVNERIRRLRTSSIIFIRNRNVNTTPLWITKKRNKCYQEPSSDGINAPCEAIDGIHISDVALNMNILFIWRGLWWMWTLPYLQASCLER